MFPINGPGATSDKKFTEGDPLAGVPATVVTAKFMNDVQAELLAIMAGATPPVVASTAAQNQVLTAIQSLIAASVSGLGALPLAYINGFQLSNDATLPNTTVDVSAGSARSSDNTVDLKQTSTLRAILQATGAWAAGDNQNKLDTGARANSTWYHLFSIRKTSDGTTDLIYSLSPTTPALPVGYAGARWLGAVFVNASGNIRQFTNEGDVFFWKDVNNDINNSGVTAGSVTLPIATPPGRKVLAYLDAMVRGENTVIHVRSPDTNAVTLGPTATGGYVCGIGSNNDGSTAESVAATTEVLTNTSSQVIVQTYASTGNIGFAVSTRGYKVFR